MASRFARPRPVEPAYLRDLFARNAASYDRVNTLISLGRVSRWRREAIALARIPASGRVLDAFAGPGSLAGLAARRLGPSGELTLVDLSPTMLDEAGRRLSEILPAGRERPAIKFRSGDLLAEDLEIGRFDAVLLGFGLRYVPDVSAALRRLRGLLAADGRLVVLEFTRPPTAPLWSTPVRLYFRHVLPSVAAHLADERELYDYLADSSAGFLTPGELGRALWQAGLTPLDSRVHLGGLVTVIAASRTPGG